MFIFHYSLIVKCLENDSLSKKVTEDGIFYDYILTFVYMLWYYIDNFLYEDIV